MVRPSRRPCRAACVAAVLLVAAAARAEDEPATPTPVDSLGGDLVRAFTGPSLLWFGGAALGTALLSPTGGDHAIRVAVVRHVEAPFYGDAAYYGGYVGPAIVAPGIYLSGLLARDPSLAGAGSAATQALAITVVTTVVLKVGTGRPFPLNGGNPRAPDRLEHPEYARDWSPFGFEGRYAWPSGHTSAAVSIAASLTAFAPDQLWVPAVSYPIALGIGFGMMVGDHHWTSDVVSGAFIGQAIGWSVGTSFRERQERRREKTAKTPGIQLVPLLSGVRGCAIVGVF